jgi:hypothetical protein
MGPVHQPATLGAEFARALAAKDSSRMLDLMHPEIDFGGMTPKRTWEANDRDAVISVLLRRFLVDQQAYLSARNGRIGWMRVLCSGYRRTTSPE